MPRHYAAALDTDALTTNGPSIRQIETDCTDRGGDARLCRTAGDRPTLPHCGRPPDSAAVGTSCRRLSVGDSQFVHQFAMMLPPYRLSMRLGETAKQANLLLAGSTAGWLHRWGWLQRARRAWDAPSSVGSGGGCRDSVSVAGC